jgi:chromosome partitioning protein
MKDKLTTYNVYQYEGFRMILLIGGEKGGTGKTTLCTNLAAIRASSGIDVLIVDADKQASAMAWSIARNASGLVRRVPCIQKFGINLPEEVLDIQTKHQDIIIDAGGRDWIELRAAMSVADRMYIPLQASQFDVWTLEAMDSLLRKNREINRKLQAFVIINRASTNPSVSEALDAAEAIKDFENFELSKNLIRERISFRKAARSGLSVCELKPQDSRAIQEIQSFALEVFDDSDTQSSNE